MRRPASGEAAARQRAVRSEQLLFWCLLELWVLNVADLLLTRYALWLGFATEENGVMRYFLHEGTLLAAAFKIGIVTVGVVALWHVRRRPAALAAAVLLTVVFAAVVAYQAAWVLSL
jgi:Domain of unknown function (DUF5658)